MLVRPNLWCILLLAFVKAASELVADDTFTDRNQLHAGNAESKINKEELILGKKACSVENLQSET